MVIIIIFLLLIGAVNAFLLSLYIKSFSKHHQDIRFLSEEYIRQRVRQELEQLPHSTDSMIQRLDDQEAAIAGLKDASDQLSFVVRNMLFSRRGGSCEPFQESDPEDLMDRFSDFYDFPADL